MEGNSNTMFQNVKLEKNENDCIIIFHNHLSS